jgi:hypothetical protein
MKLKNLIKKFPLINKNLFKNQNKLSSLNQVERLRSKKNKKIK